MFTRLLLILCLALPSSAAAQPAKAPREPRPVFAGSAVDSTTGRPIVRAIACSASKAHRLPRCTQADSLGRFLLTELPLGDQVLYVTCQGLRAFETHWMVTDTVRLTAADTIVRNVVFDAAKVYEDRGRRLTRCDMRPFRRERVTVSGPWIEGFEENRFTPCGDSITAWVSIPDSLVATIKWPKIPKGKLVISSYVFVRFEGILEGPGLYGHGPNPGWGFSVERIHSVKSKGSCPKIHR